MSDPQIRLEEHLGRIDSRGSMSDGDALRALALVRQLMEHHSLQSQYPLLNFFCNWVLHTELSDSRVCYRMLEQITDIFLTEGERPGADIVGGVSKVLSVGVLRAQLRELLVRFSLSTSLTGSFHNWNGFSGLILADIVNKPIRFPENLSLARYDKAREILASMKARANGQDKAVAVALMLSNSVPEFPGQVTWTVLTAGSIRLCGPLIREELRAAFMSD